MGWMCLCALMLLTQCTTGYVDLGLPSGTLWKESNEDGLHDYEFSVERFGCSIPTKEQWEELQSECSWTWVGDGYKVQGPNGAELYLPAAGWVYCDGVDFGEGSYGDYWSSTAYDETDAWSVHFHEREVKVGYDYRCLGHSIRLVKK